MPSITEISAQKNVKNRYNLYIDGEFFVGLSLETIMKARLKVGMEIEKDKLSEIVLENEKSDALNKACNYISKSLKTKREVKDYLLGKGFSEEVVWHCIDKLKEYNYIDDEEYSKKYVETNSKGQGRRLIEYKLMMKGVKKADISTAYEECDIDGKENARNVAVKYLKNKEITIEILAKAYRYLIGRGFSHDEVSYALLIFKKED